jgi:hypothetical protein
MQRGESYHSVMREITNGQLSIKQSAKHLATKVLSILKDISTDEELSSKRYPRVTQLHGVAFRQLRNQITIYAAKMLKEEWQKLSNAISAGESLGEY